MEPSDDLPDLRHIDKYVRLLVRTYIRRENIYILESLIYRIKIQNMISITSKEMCCGCAACEQRCPKSCIVMREDEEGFLYPQTDMSKCIDCGLCEKVCPVLNQGEKRKPLYVYAAKNKNPQIQLYSSSGGVFTHIAEQIIQNNGVVFGARFDENWAVKHDYTETLEGLAAMRGSKYVQSRIGSTYQQAKDFLEAGRLVLFSGTPCQIRGLKLFLAKEYENLLTVDLVCHGVPSPEIWRQYLHEIIATGGADIQIPSCGPHPKLRVSISGTRRPDGKATVCGSHSAERPGSVFRRRQTYPEYTIRIHSFTASCRM